MKPKHQIFRRNSPFTNLIPRHGRDPKASANVGSGSFDFPKVWVTKMAGKYIMTWQKNPRTGEVHQVEVVELVAARAQESNPTL